MKLARALLFGAIMVSGSALGACHRTNSEDELANDPLAASTGGQEDKFGKGFGKAFRAPPNSEPANVVEGDVVPVSNTAEPVQID